MKRYKEDRGNSAYLKKEKNEIVCGCGERLYPKGWFTTCNCGSGYITGKPKSVLDYERHLKENRDSQNEDVIIEVVSE